MAGLFDWLGRKVNKSELKGVTLQAGAAVAFKELALQTGISIIAGAVSKCEFKVYVRGKSVRDELYYALNVRPNPNQNSSEFIHDFINRLYRRGEALVIQHRGGLYVASDFQIDERPILGNRYESVAVGDKRQITFRRPFEAGDVLHFKLDAKPVRKLIDGIYDDYGKLLSAAMDDYLQRCGRKYKYHLDQYKAGDAEFNAMWDDWLRASLKDFVQNPSGVWPEYRGTELTELQSPASARNSSLDVINLRREAFDIVAQALKIPLPLMYGNMTNLGEIADVFLTFCIDPLADMISEEITCKTSTAADYRRGNFVRVDTRHIRHADLFDIAPGVDKLISSGMFSINELRGEVDADRLEEDWADAHFVTKNYENQTGQGSGGAPAASPAPPSDGGEGGDAEDGAEGR